jgi:phasin
MTKKSNATASPTEAGPYASIMKTFGGLQDKFEIPESAREFVKRGTASAKERAADMHNGANKVASAIEGAVVNAVTSIADVNRKLIEAAHEDAEAALAAIDKLAEAKSLGEAYQLQVDYWRQRNEVGMARARNVAEFVSAKVSDGVKAVQDGIAKAAPFSYRTV